MGQESYKQIDLFKVTDYLWTPTNLSLVAASRDDNVKSKDFHEEQGNDENDTKELFCKDCRWKN